MAAALLCGTVVPVLARYLVRRSEARRAETRGELSTAVVDLVQGAPDLIAYGAANAQLRRAGRADAELTRVAGAAARTAGIGSGLTTLLAGLCVWGVLVAGIVAVDDGQLPRCPAHRRRPRAPGRLRVGHRTPAGLRDPRAGTALPGTGRCALLTADDPVSEPSDSDADCRPRRTRSGSAACAPATRPDRSRSTGSTWTWLPGRSSRWSVPAGPASPRWPPSCCGSSTSSPARPR